MGEIAIPPQFTGILFKKDGWRGYHIVEHQDDQKERGEEGWNVSESNYWYRLPLRHREESSDLRKFLSEVQFLSWCRLWNTMKLQFSSTIFFSIHAWDWDVWNSNPKGDKLIPRIGLMTVQEILSLPMWKIALGKRSGMREASMESWPQSTFSGKYD